MAHIYHLPVFDPFLQCGAHIDPCFRLGHIYLLPVPGVRLPHCCVQRLLPFDWPVCVLDRSLIHKGFVDYPYDSYSIG